MKIAIVGSSGYIASFLLESFSNDDRIDSIFKIDKVGNVDAKLDLVNANQFEYSCLDDIEYIIFMAAISSPDKCAEDYDLCWKVNVDGTIYFIRKALEKKCKVMFFSSDAVFGDSSEHIYSEDSETCPITPYGKMKKHVEDEFKANSCFKAIRLSYVASSKDKFVSYCLKCIRENDVAEVFHPFYRSCIVVSDVIKVVEWFVNNWNIYEPYALNVAGGELVSRLRIADEINRILNGRLRYQVVVPHDDFFRNRPKITHMKSIYLSKYAILADESFTEKIQRELEDYFHE